MKTLTLPFRYILEAQNFKWVSMAFIISTFMIFAANAQSTTVVDIIVNSPDHQSLEDAVIAAELDDDLSGPGPFTVFAPTDDAFAALGQETIDALFADPTGDLADILLYHVVGAEALSTDLSDGQMITTLNGDSITVKIDGGNVYIDNAMVTSADIQTDNGVVHVIDAVIVPTYTVADVVIASPDHNSLEAAVIAAGLAETLAGEGPFTVFAPTDDAFAALGQETIDALFADPTGDLADILLYHVVGAEALSTDLSDGQMITTLNGDSITVKIDGGNVYIDNAMVTSADIQTDNGVVHVIDAVIVPTYTVADVVIASPDHNSLEAAVIAAGLAETLAGEGPFTVFAPTDDAFAALGQETIDALFADPTGDLADILLYHVVGAEALSTDLSDGQMITTLNGDSITVKIDGGNVYIDNAMVTSADIQTDNGVVHVIDAVIVPTYTVADVVIASPDHNSLEAAVIAAGLAETLAGEGPFTVFAPTDDAFAALGQETIDALFADPTGDLADILLYHVVGAEALSTDLSDGQMITTLNGDSITVKIDGGNVYIDNAMVTSADIQTDNGVVHVIDAVIVPTYTVADVVIASPDHNSLEAAVIATGLAETLAGEGPFTVFAPTDDAFAALGQETIDALFADPTGDLADILLYHVVGAEALSTDLSDGQIIEMMDGTDAFISLFNGMAYINQAEIITTDITTDNGVIHIIDAVITQPKSIVDIVVNSPRHHTLETAVIEAELAGALSAEGSFTLFAPTDEAFAALGQETIDALLADPKGDLSNILKYHVAGAKALSGDLNDGQNITTLEGSDINVTIGGSVMIDDAMVIFADYEAPNGVVHIIDAVIQPETATSAKDIFNVLNQTKIYPNPATDRLNFMFELDNSSEVSIEVYDMVGQKVFAKALGKLPSGIQYHAMSTTSMENGIYIVIVKSGSSTKANRVRVVR